MMAPKYERLRMLGAALDLAGHELDEPVDRLEVRGGQVLVWAGDEFLALDYGYHDAYDPQGAPILGGGRWTVQVARLRKPLLGRSRLARLFGLRRG